MLKDYNKKEQETQAKVEKYFGLNPGEGESFVDVKPNRKNKVKATKLMPTESMPTGNIGSVDRTADVINSAPNMSTTNVPAPVVDKSIQTFKPFRNTDPSKVVDKDRSTYIDPQLQAQRALLGMKKGGFVHTKDAMAKHSSGFQHNSEITKKYSAGFKSHIDHVKTMCGGGMTKEKK